MSFKNNAQWGIQREDGFWIVGSSSDPVLSRFWSWESIPVYPFKTKEFAEAFMESLGTALTSQTMKVIEGPSPC